MFGWTCRRMSMKIFGTFSCVMKQSYSKKYLWLGWLMWRFLFVEPCLLKYSLLKHLFSPLGLWIRSLPVFSTGTMDQIPKTPVFSTVTMDQIPPPLTEHSLPPKENRRRNSCPDDSETACRVDVVGFVILWRSLVQISDWPKILLLEVGSM